ncbi:MAG: lysylphosphatidylglycerol synthase transmembrane domain-containing protein [Culicoidibacterales bacterium]
MSNNKKNLLYFSLITLVTIFVIYFSVKDDFQQKLQLLLAADPSWLLAAIGCVVIWWLSEAYVMQLIAKTNHNRYRFFDSLMVSIIGQFYSALTPMASGGQVFQIFYMRRQGLKIHDGVMITLLNLSLYIVALMIFCGCFAVINFSLFNETVPNFLIWLSIGLISNFAVYLLLVLLATSTKIHKFIVSKIIVKFTFIKNLDQKLLSLESTLSEFRESFQTVQNNKSTFLKVLLINLVRLLIFNAVPFFIALSLHVPLDGSWVAILFDSIAASAIVALIVAFVPLPGGSGGAEFIFTMFFLFLFQSPSSLIVGMLLWRTSTFFFTLFVGGAITFSYTIWLNRYERHLNN